MGGLPWFRLYHRMIDDEKLRLLAFEDRWHFVALCCLKADGLLDEDRGPLWERKVAVKLGVQLRELDEISRRLHEVGLIDGQMHPVAWDELQYKSDNSTARVKAFRKRQQKQGGNSAQRCGNVSVTAQDTDTESDTEKKEPPKAPRKRWAGKPDFISDEFWQEWRGYRKSTFTQTALDGFLREAEKAGWTLEAAMREAMERGWQGFKADWVKERKNGGRNEDKRDGIAKALDRRLGLGESSREARRQDAGDFEGSGQLALPACRALR